MSEAKTILSAEDRSAAAWASWRGQVNSAQRQITGFQQATAAALTAAPLIAFTSGISRAIGELDRLGDQAPKVGLTAQALGELNFASRQNAGGAEVMEGAMGKLSVRIADAAGGSKEAAAVFKTLGVQITDTNGKIKAGDQVLADLADRFAVMPEGPLKTALAIEVFGKSGKEMLPLLNQGSAGLQQLREEFVRLNGGPVTEAVAQAQEWNDQLDKLWTMSQGYFAHVAQEVLPLLNQLISDYTSTAEATGEVSTAGAVLRTVLEALVVLGADVAYVFKQTGNELGAMAAQIAALARGDMDGFRAISVAVKEDADRARRELDRFQERVLNAGALGKISKAAADAEKAFNAGTSPNLSSAGSTPVINKGTEKVNKELQEQAKLLAELAGLTGSFAEDWARLNTLYARGAINVDQLAAAQAELLAKQPAFKKAQQEQNEEAKALMERWADEAKALAELAKVMEDYAKANAEGVASAVEAANQAEQDLDNWGKLKSEIQAVTLAQLEQSRELAALAGEDVSNIQKRIDAQRRLIAATQGVETKEAIKQLAEDSNREWQKSFDMTRQSLADALMDGGKKGSDYVKGLFNNMVVRPAIEYALTPVASGVASIFGGGRGGGGAGGLQSVGGLLGNFGGMSFGNTAGSMVANMTGGGLDALLATNGAFGTAAGGAGIMGTLGTVLPWVGGALGLASLLESPRGGPKTEGGADIAASIQAQYNALAQQLGITSGARFGAFSSQDPQGDALTQLQVAAFRGDTALYSRQDRVGNYEDIGRSQEALQAAVAEETVRAIFAAISTSDLEDKYRQYLNGVTEASGVDEMQAALTRLTAARTLEERLLELTSTEEENLARARQRQLKDMDAALRPLAEQVWALEDAANAATTVLADMSGEIRAYATNLENTAFAGLERAIETERTTLNLARDVALEQISSLRGMFDMLGNGARGLYDQVSSTRAAAGGQGSNFISQALATARASGYLPDADQLAQAVTAAQSAIAGGAFGRGKDADFARLVLAGQLTGLKEISGEQLTEAERTLRVMDDQLAVLERTYDTARAQLDATRGNSASIMTLAQALVAFQAATAGAGAVRTAGGVGMISNDDIAAWTAPRLGVSEAANLALYNDAAANRERGVTLDKIDAAAGLAPGTSAAWAIARGLTPFAMGGAFAGGVVHKPTTFDMGMMGEGGNAEGILPLANVGGRLGVHATGGAGVGELAREVAGLRADMRKVFETLDANAAKTADLLDRVTGGGNAMRSKAVA